MSQDYLNYLKLPLDLGERSYDILISAPLAQLPDYLIAKNLDIKNIGLVTTQKIEDLTHASAELILELEKKHHAKIVKIILQDGEAAKSWESLNQIFTALLSNHMPRSTLLLALGGGVVGDVTGLAASLYQRGITYVQIPTTLLAQVDSSVGGKTAINHPLGKNMIGSFYQPKLVWMDLNFLNTLPHRAFASGLAEVIKYGLIWDPDFFEFIEKYAEKILNRELDFLKKIIFRSCEIKAKIVSQDEKETAVGVRAILNFGHTYGHALETLANYDPDILTHGEAVALGMRYELNKSIEIFNLDKTLLDRLDALLTQFQLPTKIPKNLLSVLGLEPFEAVEETKFQSLVYEAMQRDKKNKVGKIGFILLKKIGHAVEVMI